MSFARHLIKDAFRDVVIAPPIGCALGIGELIKVVAVGLLSEQGGSFVNLIGALTKWQRPPNRSMASIF